MTPIGHLACICSLAATACADCSGTAICRSPLDNCYFAVLKGNWRGRMDDLRESRAGDGRAEDDISDAEFERELAASVAATRHHLPAYYRHCNLMGRPAGTPCPQLPRPRGTEMPFGKRPLGAPLPRGASAAAKSSAAVVPLAVIPSIVADPISGKAMRLLPLGDRGMMALARGASRVADPSSLTLHRDTNGVPTLGKERSAEAAAAKAARALAIQHLPEGKLTAQVTVGKAMQALAASTRRPIELLRLSERALTQLQVVLPPADEKKQPASARQPGPLQAPAPESAPVRRACSRVRFTTLTTLPDLWHSLCKAGNRVFVPAAAAAAPAPALAKASAVRHLARRHAGGAPAASKDASVFDFGGREDSARCALRSRALTYEAIPMVSSVTASSSSCGSWATNP